MTARHVTVLLLFLLAVVHAQLWFGRGSLTDVQSMQRRLSAQQDKNAQTKLGNEQLLAEVRDLQSGLEMVEEKARKELGMVKPNEVFVQLVQAQ